MLYTDTLKKNYEFKNVLTKGKYYKGNYIDWRIAIYCAIGGTIGGYIGAKLLRKIPEKYLKIAFTILLIYVSFKMLGG